MRTAWCLCAALALLLACASARKAPGERGLGPILAWRRQRQSAGGAVSPAAFESRPALKSWPCPPLPAPSLALQQAHARCSTATLR